MGWVSTSNYRPISPFIRGLLLLWKVAFLLLFEAFFYYNRRPPIDGLASWPDLNSLGVNPIAGRNFYCCPAGSFSFWICGNNNTAISSALSIAIFYCISSRKSSNSSSSSSCSYNSNSSFCSGVGNRHHYRLLCSCLCCCCSLSTQDIVYMLR